MDLPLPKIVTSRVRPQTLPSSKLMSAAILPGGKVGFRAKYLEPRSPCSSAATNSNRTLRRGGSGSAAKASATDSAWAIATPLSSAPL